MRCVRDRGDGVPSGRWSVHRDVDVLPRTPVRCQRRSTAGTRLVSTIVLPRAITSIPYNPRCRCFSRERKTTVVCGLAEDCVRSNPFCSSRRYKNTGTEISAPVFVSASNERLHTDFFELFEFGGTSGFEGGGGGVEVTVVLGQSLENTLNRELARGDGGCIARFDCRR